MRLRYKKNLGPLDRGLRILGGLVFIALAFGKLILPWYAIWAFYLFGLSQIVEGAAGY